MKKSRAAKWVKWLTFYGWPLLLLPFLIMYAGVGLNQLVIAANHGSMPVAIPPCFADGAAPGAQLDPVHACITPQTHLKLLSDLWITDADGGIAFESVGDMLLMDGMAMAQPLTCVWIGLALACYWFKRDFWIKL